MQLAYVMSPVRGDLDLVLSQFARDLLGRGIRVCGAVQTNTEAKDGNPCDMDLAVLPDGPTLRISQSLGHAARGCRLDLAALEMTVASVEARLSPATDLLIVNKFGRHEADGRGFCSTIAQALDMDVPVILEVNQLNLAAFEAWSGGAAVPVPLRKQALMHWFRASGARAA